MNIERARFNMVEQQIRPWNVLDPNVLDLLFEVRREEFVPQSYRSLAFADVEIPLTPHAVMMPPRMEARMLQELELAPDAQILQVGTGSGYMTALLASQGAHVTSLEIDPALQAQAQANLEEAGIENVTLILADGLKGYEAGEPYDAIVLTGSVPSVPDVLLHQLALGGRLMAVVGSGPVMEMVRIHCTGPGSYSRETLFETWLPPLENAPRATKSFEL
jgi:protein-L-isoaspartate(D-aspartate) O-methyltransferase